MRHARLTLIIAASVTAFAVLWVLQRSASRARANALPDIMLWAWERPENLEFLNPREAGVAFLSRSIGLTGNSIVVRPRLQPLRLAKGIRLVAVARIEPDPRRPPSLSLTQRDALIAELQRMASQPRLAGIQIDFDATPSQRGFYREVLITLRRSVTLPISITALASWCLDDRWLEGLPVDEAVPMLFRMGPDDSYVRSRLRRGGDFREPLCRQSVGVSTDERLPALKAGRRVYVFHPRPWSPVAYQSILREVKSWQ